MSTNNILHSSNLEYEIKKLAREVNAVILAHYYQEAEIQDLADFIGDSLELSRKAAQTSADFIVFCGVRFMAEVAKILSPSKTVLIPDMQAGCSLESSCPSAAFKYFCDQHPDHLVVSYINCSAEVKALSDIICTSSSAQKIISSLPLEQKIIFAPDRYLGTYLEYVTQRKMLLWNGTCIVHEQFSEKELVLLINKYREAKVLAHPECPENILRYADHIGSTSSLIKYVETHSTHDFIILTEPGIIHQMQKKSPSSTFYSVSGQEGSCTHCNKCPYMRLNTLEKLYLCLLNKKPAIVLNETIRLKAKAALDRMLEIVGS